MIENAIIFKAQKDITITAVKIANELSCNLITELKRPSTPRLESALRSALWTQKNLDTEIIRVSLCLSEALLCKGTRDSGGFTKEPPANYFHYRLSEFADVSLMEAEILWPLVFDAAEKML